MKNTWFRLKIEQWLRKLTSFWCRTCIFSNQRKNRITNSAPARYSASIIQHSNSVYFKNGCTVTPHSNFENCEKSRNWLEIFKNMFRLLPVLTQVVYSSERHPTSPIQPKSSHPKIHCIVSVVLWPLILLHTLFYFKNLVPIWNFANIVGCSMNKSISEQDLFCFFSVSVFNKHDYIQQHTKSSNNTLFSSSSY